VRRDRKNKPRYRLVEGRNPVLEALRAGTKIFELLVEQGLRRDEKIDEIFRLSGQAQIRKKRFTRRRLEKISRTGVHQGIIAKAAFLEPPTIRQIINACFQKGKSPFFVVLSEVEYAHNLGAVMRSAEVFGANAVITGRREMQVDAVVTRASMGATEYIPLIHENIFNTLKLFKKEGIKTVAAEAKGKKSLFEASLSGPLALVIGGEHKGITETVFSRVDEIVYIPMFGQLSSLNLSVAAGILMYETMRQRTKGSKR